MESWDDDNFEPKVVPTAVVVSNKWEGEDEEDEVKESWEDEDEEQKIEEQKESVPKGKKKTPFERIAEKEKLRREENERRLREQEEEEDISPEEKLKRQRESDINLALETTFVDSNTSSTGLDAMNPTTKEEFQEFVDAFSAKIQPLSKNAEYPVFAENLIRNICATLSSFDIKKVKTTIDNLYLEKQKIEKGDKTRKSKTKGKAKLKLDNDNQFSAYVDDYDEFDDFM